MPLPRLIFITGKGGTGKSTMAAALACALARHHRTTLADLDRRGSSARLLGAPSADAATSLGRNLDWLPLSPRAELESFVGRIVPVRALSRRMIKSRTFGYVCAALPGLEAFLMLERLSRLADSAALEDRYVIVDAPATGSALELLTVVRGVERIAPTGTLYRLAKQVARFIADGSRFGLLLTLTPADLALREALDAAATLSNHSIQCLAGLLNGVTDPLFDADDLRAIAHLNGHARIASLRADRTASAIHARERLARAGLRFVELPMVFKAKLRRVDLNALGQRLEQGLAQ